MTLTVRDDTGLGNGVSTDQIAVHVDQGPVASAGADILACAGTEVQFDGTGSTDIDGVVNSFTWDFGDGSTGGGETPSHIYERPGDYRVFLTIEGEKAGICSASLDRRGRGRGSSRARSRSSPRPPAVPITDTVTFDGSASHMAEGKITAYEWDFGDGTTATRRDGNAPICRAGHLRRLADAAEQLDLADLPDRVGPAPDPGQRHARSPPPARTSMSRPARRRCSTPPASRDPDGGIVAYEWDFGDGTTATGIAGSPPLRGGRNLHREARRPRRGGPRQFVLGRRADGDGQPGAGAGDRRAEVACVAEDGRPGRRPTRAKARPTAGSSATATRRRRWRRRTPTANPGRYSLVLVADDGKGQANSVQQTTRVVHVNRPPFAEAGPDRMVCPGDTLSFDASASRDLDGTIGEYRWDFGDGTTAGGAAVEPRLRQARHLPGVADGGRRRRLELLGDHRHDERHGQCAAGGGRAAAIARSWIGGANDAILLDGSASTDPDGQALTHDWQIGGEGSETGARVRYTLSAAGEIPVTLTVSDTSGLACGTASGTFTILAKPR